MPRTNQPGRTVAARLIDVLFAFRPGRTRLNLAALTRITGMPHATVRRLTLELVDAGLLDKAPDGTFTVGIRLWELGTLAPLTVPLRTVALPFMEDLAATLRQHVQLAVLDGNEAVIVERMSAPRAVDLVSQVGGRLPLHSSGVGKILLAHAPRTLFDRITEAPLAQHTMRTCTDPEQLRRMLEECQRAGVAKVSEELTWHADSVATRIMNADGEVVAALSVVVKTGSVSLHSATPSVIACGLGISRRLGWIPSVGVR